MRSRTLALLAVVTGAVSLVSAQSPGTFVQLSDKAEADLYAIIERLAGDPNKKHGSVAQQVGDLFASFSNEARGDFYLLDDPKFVDIRAKYVAYLDQVMADPHAPAEFRANVPLSNIQEFYDAFNVKPGDKLYLPPDKRVRIW